MPILVTQLGVNGVLDGTPYEQPCKTKNSTLLGFYWICNEIVFLTSLGIEIFNVIPEKRMVKSVRQLNHLVRIFCLKEIGLIDVWKYWLVLDRILNLNDIFVVFLLEFCHSEIALVQFKCG